MFVKSDLVEKFNWPEMSSREVEIPPPEAETSTPNFMSFGAIRLFLWDEESAVRTICIASGYTASVITPRFWVTYSTISLSAARLTSFHLRSERGSCTKSNSTIHWRIFCMNKSSRSAGVASTRTNKNCVNIYIVGNIQRNDTRNVCMSEHIFCKYSYSFS